MRRTRRAPIVACAMALGVGAAGLLAGCGGEADTLPRQAISGKVTLNGEPIKAGMIQFEPTAGQETAGGEAIADGQYAIPKAQGLVPGKYKVAITTAAPATAGPAPGAMPGDAPPPPKEPIPARYNAQTTLSADVTKEGSNTFDFELKSP